MLVILRNTINDDVWRNYVSDYVMLGHTVIHISTCATVTVSAIRCSRSSLPVLRSRTGNGLLVLLHD